ncbi:unnamed protein product [Chrysodeixis includens]|uniref:Uncharacterized protein n=1 Tax=Chrysodeixis includens TaxID=689277 RepID=A0A9N8PYB4_CHRIL|nr:unnamed protein product [Chrysodeixis includens]
MIKGTEKSAASNMEAADALGLDRVSYCRVCSSAGHLLRYISGRTRKTKDDQRRRVSGITDALSRLRTHTSGGDTSLLGGSSLVSNSLTLHTSSPEKVDVLEYSQILPKKGASITNAAIIARAVGPEVMTACDSAPYTKLLTEPQKRESQAGFDE